MRVSRRVIIGVLVAVVACTLVVGIALSSPLFAVKTITVNGVRHLSSEEVIAASQVTVGEKMIALDEQAAGHAIVQQPWVDRVTVSRQWPNTVVIDVVERDVVLFTVEQDGSHLIDAQGVVFTIGTPPKEAVRVSGDGVKDPAVMQRVAAAMALVEQPIRAQLRDVSVPSAYDVTLHLKDGRSVYWGALQDEKDKARVLSTVLSQPGKEWNISNPQLVTVR